MCLKFEVVAMLSVTI